MAKIIKADGTVENIDKKLTLSCMQSIVGGLIELVYLSNAEVMVVDEEGKLKNKNVNVRATHMYANVNDVIVGDVILANTDEID